MTRDSELPIPGAKLIDIPSSTPPEGLVLLPNGVLVSGDCLQNWGRPDRYFNLFGRVMMRLLGFIKAHNIGPGWLKEAEPAAKDLRALLELDFEHVLPAHGAPVIGGAKDKFRRAIERVG